LGWFGLTRVSHVKEQLQRAQNAERDLCKLLLSLSAIVSREDWHAANRVPSHRHRELIARLRHLLKQY